MKVNKLTYILILVVLFSCSDIFGYKKRIAGRYYLMETDSKSDLAVYYKTSTGDFIGRIPSTVLEYGFTDSFIVAKCKQNTSTKYYIIERSRDSDFAEIADILIADSITEKEFKEKWSEKLKINLIKVP